MTTYFLGVHIQHEANKKQTRKKAANISLKPVDILNKLKRKAITNNNNFMCTMNDSPNRIREKIWAESWTFWNANEIQRKLRQIKNPSTTKNKKKTNCILREFSTIKTDDEKRPNSIHISEYSKDVMKQKRCWQLKERPKKNGGRGNRNTWVLRSTNSQMHFNRLFTKLSINKGIRFHLLWDLLSLQENKNN